MNLRFVSIDGTTLKDELAIERLTNWRNKNLHTFLNQTPVTCASTHTWLMEVINNRWLQLWWVKPSSIFETPIGHIGLVTHPDNLEIGYVMRGEDRYPGMMGLALEQVIEFCPYAKYTLRVLPSNTHAIEFYKRHKFAPFFQDDNFLHMRR